MSGREFIYFTVAGRGLCFGFVLRTVLVTQGCFHYCWAGLVQYQGLCCFSPHSTLKWVGGAQGIGRRCSWGSWSRLTKDTPHTLWHHTQHTELGEKGGVREWAFEHWHCVPKPLLHMMEPGFPSWTLFCWWEAANLFFVLLFLKMILLTPPSLTQPVDFLTFTVLILSPVPFEGSKWMAVWGLAAGWGQTMLVRYKTNIISSPKQAFTLPFNMYLEVPYFWKLSKKNPAVRM